MENLKNKKKVYFLSASDRINYGDLLFPIICKKVYKNKNIDFQNYGIVKRNLSSFGALPGKSYKELQSNTSKYGGNILIGGGEVLFADWQVLLSYLNPIYNRLIKIRNFRRLNKILKLDIFLFNKTQNPYPFIIKKKWNINIFYNAVGGVYKNDLAEDKSCEISKALNSSTLLSVRDLRTLKSLKEKGVSAKLIPDSAIILSDIFPKKKFLENIRLNMHIPLKKSYLFVQVGRNCAPADTKKFVENLENIAKEMKVDILLCPIGLASGHEDHIILKQLSNLSDKLKYYHPKCLYEIMTLIAFSRAYLGTSLHGLLTAQSYSLPFIPLNRKLRKVEEYCMTWTSENINRSLEFTKINKATELIESWDESLAKINLQKQKELVYQNFENMWNNFN